MGVAWRGDGDEFQEFIDRYELTFPQISDDTGEVFSRFEIPTQPAFAIIAPDGEVQTLYGPAGPELLDALIDATLV